jgi:FdrA protein
VAIEHTVIEETYRDSVKLMRLANEVSEAYALSDATALMGTEANRERLAETTALDPESLVGVGPSDLVLLAVAEDSERAASALADMRERLDSDGSDSDSSSEHQSDPTSLAEAIGTLEHPELALISVPGEYAAREAWLALHSGLHVQLFSDSVPIAAERELKKFGLEEDLLVMGPDCGTAIIDGLPLGFANVVSQGSIGLVSASGTGLQEVASLIDRGGGGISQAIGTGGRDLHDSVGGLMTSKSIERLDDDPETDCLVVISKPPDPSAREAVLDTIEAAETPVVVQFLGATDELGVEGVETAGTLADAATMALDVAGEPSAQSSEPSVAELSDSIEAATDGALRGLFSGGTLCTEAALFLSETVEGLATNVGVGDPIVDPLDPEGRSLVDLGADELTRGRPHPMIDTGLRDSQLAEALADDTVGMVLLDVVLGRGAHADPAAGIAEQLDAATAPPPVVASVCGTDADPQGRSEQVETLREAGVVVAPSNAAAAAVAASAVAGGGGR